MVHYIRMYTYRNVPIAYGLSLCGQEGEGEDESEEEESEDGEEDGGLDGETLESNTFTMTLPAAPTADTPGQDTHIANGQHDGQCNRQ